jgi:hypothetical protein
MFSFVDVSPSPGQPEDSLDSIMTDFIHLDSAAGRRYM